MQAIYIDEPGGPENFQSRALELAPPAAGEVRVVHSAIGLNFIDIYQRKGLYPMAMPAILGSEAAGRIDAVGEGVSDFSEGDRVVYLGVSGGYAGAANVPAAMCAKLPDSVSDETAAASFLKGLTADMLVRQVFPLKAGDTCLVYAAAGGVGALLCQWAADIGADVIAVVGNPEKAAVAKENGAKHVIIRIQTSSIAEDTRKLTGGRGVEVVYDSVGAATFETSLDALATRGMMVSYGNASGPPPALSPLDLARRGSLTLVRPTLFHYATPGAALSEMASRLFAMLERGALKPPAPTTFPLADVAEAHRRLESGETVGATVLLP
ncbi:MAG: quinone oxidoreductase [Pseudomonadota bacterium]